MLCVARSTRVKRRLAAAAVLIVWCASAGSARAATGLPPGFQDALVASGLSSPTAMEFAPDGRLFVAQKGGQLRVIKNGVLLPTPFHTLIVNSSGERGLLGIAFDPNFASNQFVYVYYTATTPAVHNRISRFTANGDVKNAAVAEEVLLDFENVNATNHNGGALHFGPDGKLYAAHGENADSSNSQTLTTLLGKIIRMNPVPASDPTQVPTDNPFFTMASGKNRLIWALGLRNPFTFTFQPGTGRVFINDVGASTWEEINDGIAGRNFGWPTTEGPFNQGMFPQFTNPVYAYQHNAGTPTGCAITGGAFYNPQAPTFPASYIGRYFFADNCGNWIYYINPASPATATPFAAGIDGPVDLKVGPDGALYYLAINSGSVGRIGVTPSGPQITQHPTNRAVPIGGTATFTVSAIGTQPLAYQWQKDSADIPGATSASYTTPPFVLADNNSTYRCRVTNSLSTATSNPATLSVSRSHDFDNDGTTDVAVFRPSGGNWFVLQSSTNTTRIQQWAGSGDLPVPGDYDGDGRTDVAVYRPSAGTWFILRSSTHATNLYQWGTSSDLPVAGDYDGDGRTDVAVYRPSTGTWYILRSSTNANGVYQFGAGGDVPVPGDYDGDGRTDVAVYRSATGTWFILRSSTNGTDVYQWGAVGDTPVSGDYDGDGRSDVAVYRPATGTWFILRSSTSATSVHQWGGPGDTPVSGDYDGDGRTDVAVYRPATGTWFILRSSTNATSVYQWGGPGDIPVLERR